GVREYLEELKAIGLDEKIDAMLISDPGIFTLVREILPDMEIHISTQANNTNYMTYLFWYNMGAKRVVAARELSLGELKTIRAHIPEDMEIEAFMHGAMCISYSGRCLLSSYFTGRDANRGACTHPCRWKYAVVEEQRPGEYLPVEEDDRGTYIFNSKDLCMIEYIPEMIAAGIDSFKVEGRMKTALYVAAVTRTYRQAIDDYLKSEELYRSRMDYYREEIAACTFRQFTTGFYFGRTDSDSQIYDNNVYVKNYTYLGIVENITDDGFIEIHQKNKFCVGDRISFMLFEGANKEACVEAIYDEKMHPQESAPHPKQLIYVKLSDINDIKKGMIIRLKECSS
ncbi:MAG: U32 family peptidase, partial [Wujia sp.]